MQALAPLEMSFQAAVAAPQNVNPRSTCGMETMHRGVFLKIVQKSYEDFISSDAVLSSYHKASCILIKACDEAMIGAHEPLNDWAIVRRDIIDVQPTFFDRQMAKWVNWWPP